MWKPFLWSAAVYLVVAAVLGRDVLAHLGSAIANDAGDPLLTAAILKWNATHLPLTDAWWQFPIFYPTRDTLAFSEHLLGLSVIASPIYWVTGSTLVTYNLVVLLTFPLCALAMYALVFRLTGSGAGAFVAGLAFGFAPYRIAQLSHIQMLAAFWAPLALVGLHGYIETGRRRWLVLYGVTWAVHGATSGYSLVFLSLLVGLWTLWFAATLRSWRACAMIAATTALALLPLIPVLARYVAVHAYHGFGRSAVEAGSFSVDVLAVLCAPDGLSVWGWLRVGCYPAGVLLREVEIFPGIALLALSGIHILGAKRGLGRPAETRALTILRRVLFTTAVVYAMAVGAVLGFGPWRVDLGLLRVSASTIRKPLLVTLAALAFALLLSPTVRSGIRRASTTGFYLLAALAMWSLSLGPNITFLGVPTGIEGPFAWLRLLPGIDSLRVPARFWLMAVLCLAVVAGLSLSRLLRGRSVVFTRSAIVFATIAVLSDGWIDRVPIDAAPATVPAPDVLKGAIVLELPPDRNLRDMAATFRAVEGGWTAVNGYSGYQPSYYDSLRTAARAEADGVLAPFRRLSELHVLVPADAPRLVALVERQPGVQLIGRDAALAQYRLPGLPRTVAPSAPGHRLRIAHLGSECSVSALPLAIDGDHNTLWQCANSTGQDLLTIDLGETATIGRVVHSLGAQHWFPLLTVLVETSEDGASWQEAWTGSPLQEALDAGLADPRALRIALRFPPRPARYVRLHAETGDPSVPWSVAELEVWSGS